LPPSKPNSMHWNETPPPSPNPPVLLPAKRPDDQGLLRPVFYNPEEPVQM